MERAALGKFIGENIALARGFRRGRRRWSNSKNAISSGRRARVIHVVHVPPPNAEKSREGRSRRWDVSGLGMYVFAFIEIVISPRNA